jgi:hypothetical protein
VAVRNPLINRPCDGDHGACGPWSPYCEDWRGMAGGPIQKGWRSSDQMLCGSWSIMWRGLGAANPRRGDCCTLLVKTGTRAHTLDQNQMTPVGSEFSGPRPIAIRRGSGGAVPRCGDGDTLSMKIFFNSTHRRDDQIFFLHSSPLIMKIGRGRHTPRSKPDDPHLI